MSRPYPFEIIQQAERHANYMARAFLGDLADKLTLPAAFHSRPGSPTACWLDPADCFNHAQVVTLCSPRVESIEAPLILRVAINHFTFRYEKAVRRRMGWEKRRSWEKPEHTWSMR